MESESNGHDYTSIKVNTDQRNACNRLQDKIVFNKLYRNNLGKGETYHVFQMNVSDVTSEL